MSLLTEDQWRALLYARNLAMENAVKAKIPECGDFAAIAQDLDWLCGQLEARQQEPQP